MKLIWMIIPLIFLGFVGLQESLAEEPTTVSNQIINQHELQIMVENWMSNPDENDTEQRLEIMKSYYAFEETGQQLTQDGDGLRLMNQIRKMVSFDMPKIELDQLRNQVRIELGLEPLFETKILYIDSKLVDCVGVGPMKCMMIKESKDDSWQNFYNKIHGFEFESGYEYELQVKVTTVDNPPSDASSLKYELIEIISKVSVIVDNVRHIPYNGVCAPGFMPLGQICILNDRCGPGAYAGKVCVVDGIKQPYLRPAQQGNVGIVAKDVICVEGKQLMFKSDATPVCVKPQSVDKLEKIGWYLEIPPIACTLEYAPVCGINEKTYGNMCSLTADHITMKNKGECRVSIKPTGIFEKTLEYTIQSPEIDHEKGYFVTEIADGVYWLIGGGYQTMFLTTGEGVVVFDAPQPIGEKYLDAISDVTTEPITHMIYSHHHQDHTGSAGEIFSKDITYISHKDAADALVVDNDPNRPIPTEILEGRTNTLEIGSKTIEFHDLGAFHSKGNWLILLPEYKVAMLVDLLRPDQSPYKAFGVTPDIDLYLETHDVLQTYDFDVLITGHTNLLATKDHITTNKEFTQSVMDNAQTALESGEPNPLEICTTTTIQQWAGKLGNLEAFMADHCNAMIDYLEFK